MMGVPKGEIDEVLKSEKANLRIAGFDEEEKRLKQRIANGSRTISKLPQGNYIFCDFQTLSLPGIEVNFYCQLSLLCLLRIRISELHNWSLPICTSRDGR